MAAPTFVSFTEPASNWASTADGATRTTASISMSTNDVIIVGGIVADGSQTLDDPPVSSGLTFTRQENPTPGVPSQGVDIDLWSAIAPSSASRTVAVTSSGSTLARVWGDAVYQFSGSDGVGGHNSTNISAGTNTPTVSVTTTQANSAIVVFIGDWNAIDATSRTWATVNGTAPSVGNGFEKKYFRDSSNFTIYSAYYPDVGAIGAKTVGITSPTTGRNGVVAIEIKGSTATTKAIPIFHRTLRFR